MSTLRVEGVDVRVTPSPKPWHQWHDALEVRSPAVLEAFFADGHGAAGFRALANGGPNEWLATARERLGPPIDRNEGIWLFGGGLVGQQTAAMLTRSGYRVEGFLDNNPGKYGGTLMDRPVQAPSTDIARFDRVALCTGWHSQSIRDQLTGLGARTVLGLSELHFLVSAAVEPEQSYFEDLAANRVKLLGFLLSLAEPESRRVLGAILEHRLTFDHRPLVEVASGDQWFVDGIFQPRTDHVFIDGGAFDGDTGAQFIQKNGGPGRAMVLFEPDKAIAQKARERLKEYPGIDVHAAGLWSKNDTLSFQLSGGMNGAITSGGTAALPVEAIDALATNATYIKLDVEGAEHEALEGARKTIVAHRPALAIALYHKASDLWSLPAWIEALGLGYRLRVRHHTHLAFETVVYADA